MSTNPDNASNPRLLRRDPRLKAIVFDLDGTLYQDERMGEEVNLSACRYAASLKGISVEEADLLLTSLRDQGSGTLSQALMAIGGSLQEMHRRFAEDVNPEGLLTPDPRVVFLLERLGRRFELYLYTNNNRALSARIMAEIGVSGCFKKVYSIEDHWLPKPNPVALEAILSDIGRKPEETLFVGDRYRVDLALPESLGCAVFLTCTVEELLELEQLLG